MNRLFYSTRGFLPFPKKKLENDKKIIIPIHIGCGKTTKIILKRIHEQLFEKRIINSTYMRLVISCQKCSKVIFDNQLYFIENKYEGASFLCAKCHEKNYILDDIL